MNTFTFIKIKYAKSIIVLLLFFIGFIGFIGFSMGFLAMVPAAPAAAQEDGLDIHVEPGQEAWAPAGWYIKGDIKVWDAVAGIWINKYDDDPKTATVVQCTHDCLIFAPWGANINGDRSWVSIYSELVTVGCDGGCTSVELEAWTPTDVLARQQPQAQPAQQQDCCGSCHNQCCECCQSCPEPQPVPQPQANVCNFSIPVGATAYVPQGCIVAGDVAVNGIVLYDSDQTTGLVVIMKQAGNVHATWGASVSSSPVEQVEASMLAVGCGLPDGCHTVVTRTWP